MERNQNNDLAPIAHGEVVGGGLDEKLDNFLGTGGRFIMNEVIKPGVNNMLLKGLHGLVDMMFGKKGGRYNYGGYYGNESSYYNYSSQPVNQRNNAGNPSYSNSRNRARNTKVILESWAKADEVRDILCQIKDRQGAVSVSQLNRLIDVPDRDYSDVEWGWYDISSLSIHTRGDGKAILMLPPPEYIKE